MEFINFGDLLGDFKLVPAANAIDKEIVNTIEKKMGFELYWISNSARITFTDKEGSIGIICPRTEKPIKKDFHTEYFFSIFAYQIELLEKFKKYYNVFICHSTDQLLSFTLDELKPKLKFVHTIKKDNHSMIYFVKEGKHYYLKQPKIDSKYRIDITKNLMK